MEQNKKSGLLLVAAVVGIILWIVLGIYEVSRINFIDESTERYAETLADNNPGMTYAEVMLDEQVMALTNKLLIQKYAWAGLALLLAAAIVLNILGRRKNNTKLALAAAIVYIVSIAGIPSGVLCFIGRAKLKKEQR